MIDPATVLSLLTAAPRRIAEASMGLGNEQLTRRPAPDSWSANEVLAHLRACADVWGNSIMTILSQDRPTLRHISPRTWIRKTDYVSLTFATSFEAYSIQREGLLKLLRVLPEKDWLRGAVVKASTKLREETASSYALRLAHHEEGHCDQIERILGVR